MIDTPSSSSSDKHKHWSISPTSELRKTNPKVSHLPGVEGALIADEDPTEVEEVIEAGHLKGAEVVVAPF